MADHAQDCRLGEHSPLARLEKVNARVLLLGVGFDTCTAFHLAEYRIPNPPVTNNFFSVMSDEGRRWMTIRNISLSGERIEELGTDFEKESHMDRGTVGASAVRLFPQACLVAFAQNWLQAHRPHVP